MAARKKILHVNQYGRYRGGAENYLREIAVAMTDCEHQLLFQADPDAAYLEAFSGGHWQVEDLGARVESVLRESRPDWVILYNMPGQSIEPFLQCRSKFKFRVIKSFHDYQMIYAGTGYNRLTLKRSKDPIGWHSLAGCFSRNAYTRRPRFENPFRKTKLLREINRVDAIEVHTQDMRQTLIRNQIDGAKIFLNPPWAHNVIQSNGIAKEPDSLLFVGNLIRGKGLLLLLKALRHVCHNYRLQVVGDGYQRQRLEAYATEHHLNVQFLGHIPKDQMSSILATNQMLVAPSVFEPFGFVLLEAMSHQLPVIAFDVAGPTEIVRDGETGFLVDPFDLKCLAQKIELLLSDERLRRSMGQQAYQDLTDRFSFDRHLEALRAKLCQLDA